MYPHEVEGFRSSPSLLVVSDRAIHPDIGLRLVPVVSRSFDHHTGDSTIWINSTSILRENTLEVVRYLPSLSINLMREEFRLDGYLPPCRKGIPFIHAGTRIHDLRHSSQRPSTVPKESFRLTASCVARDKPWSTLCKKSHGIPSSPRAAAVAKFRLLTGHDCLCAHLFRFNLVTSPICVLCDTGQDMTAAHLDECSALNDLDCIVKRYWRARCLMVNGLAFVN
ncbi:uncharacterized protein TNCV_608261 [Trichonephila clavipes]|nr:uncharacterized protein TNCV_608261 [Trichonephila clavipes]